MNQGSTRAITPAQLTNADPLVVIYYAIYEIDLYVKKEAAGDTGLFDLTRSFGIWSVVYDDYNTNKVTYWIELKAGETSPSGIKYYSGMLFGSNERPKNAAFTVSYAINGVTVPGSSHSGGVDDSTPVGIWDENIESYLINGTNVLTVTNTYAAPPITGVEKNDRPYWLLVVSASAILFLSIGSIYRRSRRAR